MTDRTTRAGRRYQQKPHWRQTTHDGNWVYAAAYPREGVIVVTMDDHYARLTPAEARAHARHLIEAATYTEGKKKP